MGAEAAGAGAHSGSGSGSGNGSGAQAQVLRPRGAVSGPPAGLGVVATGLAAGPTTEGRGREGSGSSGAGTLGGGGGGGGGTFFGFGRANKFKEEHAATLEKLQRDAREKDEVHETERDTLKALVRQMSSEIEILKQKLADVQEDHRAAQSSQHGAAAGEQGGGGTDEGAHAASANAVTTRWH